MKKIILFFCILFASNITFSQINSPSGDNIFYYNGLADVTFKFPLRGSGGRAFVHADGNILALNFGSDFTGGTRIGNDVYFKDGGNSFISSGNFGVGTTNPTSSFSVGINHGIKLSVGNPLWANTAIIQTEWNAEVGDFTDLKVAGHAYNNSYIRIIQNGNLGIGITNPDEKLTVKGKIHAEEVRIDLSFPAPDYVFDNDYKLKSLQEVEMYIKQNSHLPEIPSAQEIEKNGLMLAEMNMALLKKIEELTLYSIEQEKKSQLQHNKIMELEKLNEKLLNLENRLIKIESNSK